MLTQKEKERLASADVKTIVYEYMHQDIYYIRLLKNEYILAIIYYLQLENINLAKTINELKGEK